MKQYHFISILIFTCFLCGAQSDNTTPRIEPKGNSWQFIVDGKPTVLLSGELYNSTSSSMEFMKAIWPRLKRMNLNSVIAPVYWELIESNEGEFDFSIVDELISDARQYNLKLVLVWFGTWKNTTSAYVPGWVKKDIKRFPRAQTPQSKNMNALSCFYDEGWKADAKAFARLMQHIKEVDSEENTVVCVQVENEPGIRTCTRDNNALANKRFNENVPDELISFLKKNKKIMIPELDTAWKFSNYKIKGTWTEIFGSEAEELFMAWYIASYIEKVAEAGKKEYDIPMYTNAWQQDPEYGFTKAGEYPSGGPIPKTVPIYQAAAPHLDFLSPDIYRRDFAHVCKLYQRMGNPLFIPESPRSGSMVSNAFYSVGEGALCFAPYGIEKLDNPNDTLVLAECYRILDALMPQVTKYQGTGQMKGIWIPEGKTEVMELGDYKLNIIADQHRNRPAYGIIIAQSSNEYLVAGNGFTIIFDSKTEGKPNTEVLWAYEMEYANGQWNKLRRLNGGETGRGSANGTKLQLNDWLLQLEKKDYPIVINAEIYCYE